MHIDLTPEEAGLVRDALAWLADHKTTLAKLYDPGSRHLSVQADLGKSRFHAGQAEQLRSLIARLEATM